MAKGMFIDVIKIPNQLSWVGLTQSGELVKVRDGRSQRHELLLAWKKPNSHALNCLWGHDRELQMASRSWVVSG